MVVVVEATEVVVDTELVEATEDVVVVVVAGTLLVVVVAAVEVVVLEGRLGPEAHARAKTTMPTGETILAVRMSTLATADLTRGSIWVPREPSPLGACLAFLAQPLPLVWTQACPQRTST